MLLHLFMCTMVAPIGCFSYCHVLEIQPSSLAFQDDTLTNQVTRPGPQTWFLMSSYGFWSRWGWEVSHLISTYDNLAHCRYPFPTKTVKWGKGKVLSDPSILICYRTALATSFIFILSVPSYPIISNEQIRANHHILLRSLLSSLL